MTFTLTEEQPLLAALQIAFPESSRRSLQQWMKEGRIWVDGAPQSKGNAHLLAGQTITLQRKENSRTAWGIPILYEDRWIVVIEKPAGLLSVPAEKEAPNAFHILKAKLKSTLFPVHRLDQETSGVLLFTRSKLAEEHFSALFEQHDLQREYQAIVDGHLPEKQGTWECNLREKENFDVEVVPEELGRKAITHYEVIRYSKRLTYLRLQLETGRKHQIRVQAAHQGYPILGDKRYGSLSNPYKRLCLHAYLLALTHPFTGKQMHFTSLPKQGQPANFPFSLLI